MSNWCDLVCLMGLTYVKDNLKQEIAVPVEREVYADVRSASQREFFEAGMIGLKAEKKIVIYSADYKDEKKVKYNNVVYDIYRTYEDGEKIELYAGVKNGS